MTDPIAAVGAGLPPASTTATAAAAPTNGLRAAAAALGDLGGRVLDPAAANPASMLAQVEHAALNALHPRDYLRATLVATDLSIHVSTSMMKFHLSSSLGNAATGLFNTLLKNRE